MKKILFVLFIAVITFSCSKNEEETVKPANIVGNWELDYVFNYRAQTGKSPINATLNSTPKSNFFNFGTDGKVAMKKLSFDTYGVNMFESNNLTYSYSIDGEMIKFIFVNNGKSVVNYMKIKSSSTKELVLFQDKVLFLKALEENKTVLDATKYKADLEIYNSHTRFESEVNFIIAL